MKFGPVPVSESQGAILAHALLLPDGRLKKGRLITAADVKLLTVAGVSEIIVARPDGQDVGEDEAATRVASRLATPSIATVPAFTGRVNLYAQSTGIFTANREQVDRINRVSPAITLATMDDGIFVEAGRMVATVKIIPFAVEATLVEKVEHLVDDAPVLAMAEARAMQVGLIATKLPWLKPSSMDKTAQVLSERLRPSGSTLVVEERVDHSARAVAEALRAQQSDCDLLIVFGASAITDRADVIPAGIEQCGGVVSTFGMPVDPGNLLLLGHLNGKPVIGAPGCARSPAENGFDWVLQRILCGLDVDEPYISGLGVGGLLMEITARPQPREG